MQSNARTHQRQKERRERIAITKIGLVKQQNKNICLADIFACAIFFLIQFEQWSCAFVHRSQRSSFQLHRRLNFYDDHFSFSSLFIPHLFPRRPNVANVLLLLLPLLWFLFLFSYCCCCCARRLRVFVLIKIISVAIFGVCMRAQICIFIMVRRILHCLHAQFNVCS